MARQIGTVAWFNSAKGFGFIQQQSGPDVFCHFTAIQAAGYKTLAEGDAVAFDIEKGPQGKDQATRVEKLDRTQQ